MTLNHTAAMDLQEDAILLQNVDSPFLNFLAALSKSDRSPLLAHNIPQTLIFFVQDDLCYLHIAILTVLVQRAVLF